MSRNALADLLAPRARVTRAEPSHVRALARDLTQKGGPGGGRGECRRLSLTGARLASASLELDEPDACLTARRLPRAEVVQDSKIPTASKIGQALCA